MFKKVIGVFALAGMLSALSSCTDEKGLYDASSGELVEVTFTVSSEGVLSTRALNYDGYVTYPEENKEEYPQISDGSKAKRLIWAVYDKAGNLLPELAAGYNQTNEGKTNTDAAGYGQVVEDIDHFPHTIKLTLVRGQEYSFAFWAQDENCTAFNTHDLRAVSVDYSSKGNNIANDELRDAFCKVETFTVTSAPSQNRTIILKRPFAQVNVGIPQSEYEALRQSGVRILKSTIHMENVATEFDVVSNSTHGDRSEKRQAINYEYNYIPAYTNYDVEKDGIPTDEDLAKGRTGILPQTQDLKIDLNHDGTIAEYGSQNTDGKDETYNYMLMAYILPADRNDGTSTYSTTLDRVEFSLLPEDEGQQPLTMSLENVPVQRNWRTNIFGSMFTSEVNLQIDLDPFYSGDYNYPDWERIYEGVTYNAMDGTIHITNGAGLVWLSKATNGAWATQSDFENDDTHNIGANIKNNSALFLKAVNLTKWPDAGRFTFRGINIVLDSDIDFATYGKVFGTNGKDENNNDVYYFTPIAFGDSDNIFYDQGPFFGGNFDGQNHTIYNLKTVRPTENDNRAYALFGIIARGDNQSMTIKNIRLKDVDIKAKTRAAGIVGAARTELANAVNPGLTYFTIDNCYVDGGNIICLAKENGSHGKDVAGIIGLAYGGGTITNNFVRNLTIRGYRSIGAIIGESGGTPGGGSTVENNSAYNVTLIVDWFQYYSDQRKDPEINNTFFCGGNTGAYTNESNNTGADNNFYGFYWEYSTDENDVNAIRTTKIGRSTILTNPPLDIFPKMAFFTNEVVFESSVIGGPSAWKTFNETNPTTHVGTFDEKSGRVGLWISTGYQGKPMVVSGKSNDYSLDNYTITAYDVNGDNDCVVYIKDAATVNDLTFHGATYAGQAICLAPASGKTITLNNVLAYDATKVLTDDNNVKGGTLTVEKSNFRGYVSLSEGYEKITFEGTTFEGSSKRAENTKNKLELETKATLTNCTFLVEKGSDYIISVTNGTTFENCKAYAIGKTTENDGIDITGNCTITVDDEGNVSIIK